MKVIAKNFVNFLRKVTIDGIIRDALLDFGPDGLSIVALDESKTCGVNGLLKTEGSFTDYSEMQVPIKDMAKQIKRLKLIDGVAELKVEGNLFKIIGDNYESDIMMAEKDSLKCMHPMEKWPKLGYDKVFKIDGSVLQSAKKMAECLEVKHLAARITDGIFSIQVGKSINNNGIIKFEVDYEDAFAVYGCTLFDLIKVIKGPVNIAFKDDMPLMITSDDEYSCIQWLAAPIFGEEAHYGKPL